VAKVAKHRLDNPEATPVCRTTDVTVDLALHLVEVLLWRVRDSPHEKGHLAHGGASRIAQTSRAQQTRPAGTPCATVLQCLQSLHMAMTTALVHPLPRQTARVGMIVRQLHVLRVALQCPLRLGEGLICTRWLVPLGGVQARIALAKEGVGDLRIDPLFA
jgi:hypothetical protein